MIVDKEKQKNFALFLMEKCKFDKEIIEDYRKKLNYPIFTSDVSAFNSGLLNFIFLKVDELTKDNHLCYGVTFSTDICGDCIEFLVVPKYEEDWDKLWQVKNDTIRLFAYVYNLNKPHFSEFGSVYYSLEEEFKRIG